MVFMKSAYNPDLKRRKIIEATQRILRDGGHFTKFSLEKVAQEAGVSKGGLLHHFPDKESLLRGASEDLITQFETELARELAQSDDGSPSGSFTRAYICTALVNESQFSDTFSPVLLAFLRSKHHSENVKTRFRYWHEQTEQDGLDIVLATIIRLAVDGLLYTEIIDSELIDSTLRQQVIERLLAMATDNSD